ncbi:MAG: hypothetical protein GX995_00330, partial [Clostridiales bacterium]|nr:hypothetical protein [Clostridiales bacterium]
MITGLSTVATSGSYNDLGNKPTLGTVASKNTGTASGQIPILGTGGKLDDLVIPKIAISETSVVNTQAAMLALVAEIGDVCVRTDLSKTFILKKEPASTLANWQELLNPESPVQSVAGKVGVVTLTKSDVDLGNIDNIQQATKTEFNTHKNDTTKHTTPTEKAKWDTVINKVDIIAGKGLSTEDYTTSDKNKLAGVEVGANKYILPKASESILGGIKVGANLNITEDGTLNALAGDEVSSFIIKQEIFTAIEGQTTFNLTKGYYQPNTNTLSVYIYGGKFPNIAIEEISTSSFRVTEPLKQGDVVLVEYIELSSATPYPIHGNDHLTGGYDPIPKATVSSDGLMAKEDKAKLNGIESGANKYTHPSTHPASMIVESTTKRFASDSEKSTWNAKETPAGAQIKATTALNDAKTYTDTHDADAVKHITAVERTKWNAIDNKADKSYVDSIEVGGRNYFSNSDFREGIDVYWERLNNSPASNFEIVNSELKVIFNAGTKSDFGKRNFLSQNNLEGQDYITVSSLVRGSGTLRIRFGNSTMPMQTINNTQFKRVIFTIPRSNFGNGNLIIEVASGTLYFYKIKAETGNKATDWTPSPEEIEGLIDSKVDKSQVLTDVPVNAKFTDTITTINNKTGAISKADIVALGIPAQDTVYTHPTNHPASMITESATRRFVSDTEKTNWSNKWDYNESTIKAVKVNNASNADTVNGKTVA